MNQELPDVHAGFRKGRGTRDQITSICCITEKAKEFQENIYLCLVDYVKTFNIVWVMTDCGDHDKLWKALKETGISDHLICLPRNLYAAQEATVKTLYITTDWFKIEKGV